ncbi:ABC transporter permease [Streptomyces sp. RFCAC02]|uniref:ABC transporter permease n=1 Tax=Streptomyces sp. RFCAC02 TaxID=2499143 RepID=UPI00102295FF|nr:ABC transporter permease [Streptomyces sp. RFCAC02]
MTVLKTSLRNFFAHKGRMALSGMAVVLSVAFVCGTLVFTATMNTTFDKLFASSASDVMIAPPSEDGEGSGIDDGATDTGVPRTLPAGVADEVAAVDGVERVTGTVSSTSVVAVNDENENIGPTTGPPTIAGNWTDVELRTMEITEGAPPSGAGEVMIDGDTADKHDLAIGDPLRLITVAGDLAVTVSGIADFTITNPGAAVFYLDLATAQQYLLGGQDAYTTLYVDSTGAVGDEALRDAVAAAIGGDTYTIQTADEFIEENQDSIGEVLSVLQYVLLGFAGIALLVGIFLIVNTFSMLVAQRTREIGLMRALGSSRRQVNRSVLMEALLLGVVGSVIGFGAGVGLAVGLMALMSAIGMNLSTGDLTVDASVPVIGVVLGVVVTLLAAWIPARRAARISPMAALREAGTPGDVRAGRVRAAIGAVLTVAGLGALVVAARADESSAGAAPLALGVLLSLVGLILAGPALVGSVVRGIAAVLLRVFGPVGRLAERNALRNPRRTGATASALMIGLALVAALSVVGSSLVASATEEIDQALGADFIVQPSVPAPVTAGIGDAVADVEGIERVTPFREAEIAVDLPAGGQTDVRLGAVPPTWADDVRLDVVDGDLADALAPGGVSIDPEFAADEGLGVGDSIDVTFAGDATATLTIGAIVPSDSAFLGAWYIGLDTLEEHVRAQDMPLPVFFFVTAEDGRQDAVGAGLDAAMEPYPQMEVMDQAEFKDMVQDQVGMLLNMVYGLLALAIIVAVLGVVNTLALSVVERTREIGLMRAIGLSRRQLRRMIRLESVAIALFGALVGLALGMAWGATAQRLLVLEGMDVLSIPWGTILGVFAGSAVVGLLAALFPAFRAGRMNVLNAIATD